MASDTVLHVNPVEADQLLRGTPGAVLIDVRTKIEFDYVGHPPDAIHIAWKEFPGWSVNPNFAAEVHAALAGRGPSPVEATPVFLICRSGGRSLAAGEELIKNGFTQVYNVEEGFEGEKNSNNHRNALNGWRARGLSWEQT